MKILLIDDDQTICTLARIVGRLRPDLVVAECVDKVQALKAYFDNLPDVVLLDNTLGSDNSAGVEIAKDILEADPTCKIISTSGEWSDVRHRYEALGITHIPKTAVIAKLRLGEKFE